MKANEVPEKIYLQEPTKVRTEKKYDNDVEYTRTDTFIYKACEWMSSHLQMQYDSFSAFIKDFRKAMKGE